MTSVNFSKTVTARYAHGYNTSPNVIGVNKHFLIGCKTLGSKCMALHIWQRLVKLEFTGSRCEPSITTITLLNKHSTKWPFKFVLYLSIYRLMQLSDPITEVSLCSGWMVVKSETHNMSKCSGIFGDKTDIYFLPLPQGS